MRDDRRSPSVPTGRWCGQGCPHWKLHIGIDAVASAMAEASRRAAAKPARGGVDNALFLHASLEALPGALAGLADAITVNYPWGSLLRAAVMPDAVLLANLAALARPPATLDILINMQPLRDADYAARLGLTGARLALGQPVASRKA